MRFDVDLEPSLEGICFLRMKVPMDISDPVGLLIAGSLDLSHLWSRWMWTLRQWSCVRSLYDDFAHLLDAVGWKLCVGLRRRQLRTSSRSE